MSERQIKFTKVPLKGKNRFTKPIARWVNERTITEKLNISGLDLHEKRVTETVTMRRPKNNFVRFVAWLFLRDKFVTVGKIQFKTIGGERG